MPGVDEFYRLSVEARTARYERFAVEALKRWGVHDGAPHPLKIRENAVFKVSGPGGRPAVLRIHRHGYHTDDALRSELQWLCALRADGIEVPGVIPTPGGALFETVAADGVPEPRQVDLLEWLEGEPLGTLEDGLSPRVTDLPGSFREVGRTIARLHNHASAWPRPQGFVRHAWDLDGLVGEAPLWGRFWELGALTPAQRRLILAARERARRDLIAYGTSPVHYGLIHSDINLDNFLEHRGRIKVIDFDDTAFGWHLFDLATITIFFRAPEHRDTIRRPIVEGYRELRPLPDDELAWLLLFQLARGFTYLGWVHTRHETETARRITQEIVTLACSLAEEYLGG
ncbi:MAG: phosphotransferase enzyme family protein [Alphaproteobacteria bacterium]